MKRIIVLIFILNSLFGYGQLPKIKLTREGVVVSKLNIINLTTDDVFKRTVVWLGDNYKNLEDLMYVNPNSQSIIIRAVEPKVWTPFRGGKNVNYDIEYTMIIEFNQKGFSLSYYLGHFKKNGKQLSTTSNDLFYKFNNHIRENYKTAVNSIENKLQAKNESLYQFILNYDNRSYSALTNQ